MQSVNISRLSSGGLKIIIDELSPATYTNKLSYRSFINGIMLYDESTREILVTPYTQGFFTISGVTSFGTIEDVCAALDGLGLMNESEVVLTDRSGNTLYPSGLPKKVIVEVTRPADITAYTAGDAIGTYTAAIKQKETITFTGTGGTANVVGAGGLTKLATFVDSIQQTAINFESAHAAAYALVGITLTRNLETIVLEATTAGVPFTAPTVTNVTGNLAGTVAHTTANLTLTPLTFSDVAIANNGGGIVGLIKVESNITTLASATLRLWFFNATPTGIVGDNVAYINSYANSSARCFYIDVTFLPLLAGSDTVFAQIDPMYEYVCAAADNDMYCLVQTLTAFTPTSGGKIKISLSTLALS